eukprot:CAMPEP_0178520944 /NCGR_PEP_ID=MMETSP0696-20121128/27681_1 /TAXON_ID=265572 /ORGANISM="Extubocellulus spinifer, Strain CCMP396" /LENGTH=497 /DNA_ID=CAMNT_0020151849 /DNA_START=103 /DNA_END=1596 /DNA_ORIENTATION=-
MGAGQSKGAEESSQNGSAPTRMTNGGGTNGSSANPYDYERHDTEDDDCQCSPFAFCSPKLKNVKANGSKAKSGSREAASNDLLGTPIIDTPLAARRRARGGSGGGANGGLAATRDAMPPALYMSRYGGLEKEPSGGTLDDGGGGGWERTPSAVVHEGKDPEKELYDKYEICEVLGVGSTSTCHRCINRTDGHSYACKIIDKRHIEQRFQGMIEQFHTEIEALRSLHHPNIITLYDVYITEDKIYIVMELMGGGELFDYVVAKGTLNEEEASNIVNKVTSALVYMHQKNIIHRDLKPENLLLTHKPRSGNDVDVKIIDFGLSKVMAQPVAQSFLGTRGYLAPEMLQRQEYTRSVDAWALGVIVFVLLCGCLPFDDDSQMIPTDAMVRTKFQLRFPRWAKDLSPSAKDLLSKLLDIDPRRRYTAEQALAHPWVAGKTASKDSLLQSPGRIHQLTPGGRPKYGQPGSKAHMNNMQANRAKGNNPYPNARPVRQIVRKKSI